MITNFGLTEFSSQDPFKFRISGLYIKKSVTPLSEYNELLYRTGRKDLTLPFLIILSEKEKVVKRYL